MRYVYAACIGCARYFGYDPDTVPSTSSITGRREALCRSCVVYANQQRNAMGMDPITVAAGAYGPTREDELP
jgi:hypothetical protein